MRKKNDSMLILRKQLIFNVKKVSNFQIVKEMSKMGAKKNRKPESTKIEVYQKLIFLLTSNNFFLMSIIILFSIIIIYLNKNFAFSTKYYISFLRNMMT